MSDWMEAAALAEATADRKQAAEEVAEQRFYAVKAKAEADGDVAVALQTDEFRQWMSARAETDIAWGAWSMAMDAKPVH
jgi:hypothetical protein